MIEKIAYYLRMAAIFFIYGQTFLLSGWEKITTATPQWFLDTFGGTILRSVPGISLSWKILGVVEFLVFLLLVVSLARLEVLPNRGKPWLKLALTLAALAFALLAFGQHLVREFEGAASLFFYFGATMATLLVVDKDHDAAVSSPMARGA